MWKRSSARGRGMGLHVRWAPSSTKDAFQFEWATSSTWDERLLHHVPLTWDSSASVPGSNHVRHVLSQEPTALLGGSASMRRKSVSASIHAWSCGVYPGRW